MRKICAIALAAMMGVASPVFMAQTASAADLGAPLVAPVAPAPQPEAGIDPIIWVVGAAALAGVIYCIAECNVSN